MFFAIEEIVRWIGLTVFEILLNLVSFSLFTVCLALKLDPDSGLHHESWWVIFSPMFTCDALNAYFCAIVFIRMQIDKSLKVALLRVSWSATFLLMIFLFKFLLCKKLMGMTMDYMEIFAPLFILLQLIAVRACQLSQ